MIKVSVMYANTPGARFDHARFRDSHMPLLKQRLGNIPNHTDRSPVVQISEVVVG